jgi:transcription elongation factor Elf1
VKIVLRGELVKIELIRTWVPEDMREVPCILCEQPFVVESVMASTDLEGQAACPSCVEYFGKRDPEKFPTIEGYAAALERYPEPLWASEEDLEREDLYHEWTEPASRIARA